MRRLACIFYSTPSDQSWMYNLIGMLLNIYTYLFHVLQILLWRHNIFSTLHLQISTDHFVQLILIICTDTNPFHDFIGFPVTFVVLSTILCKFNQSSMYYLNSFLAYRSPSDVILPRLLCASISPWYKICFLFHDLIGSPVMSTTFSTLQLNQSFENELIRSLVLLVPPWRLLPSLFCTFGQYMKNGLIRSMILWVLLWHHVAFSTLHSQSIIEILTHGLICSMVFRFPCAVLLPSLLCTFSQSLHVNLLFRCLMDSPAMSWFLLYSATSVSPFM